MKHALCIGINDYPGVQSDLNGCVNDAHDWSKTLQARGYQAELMLDSQATLANLKRRMQAVVNEANYGDSVVITFSGHGTWIPDTSGDEPDGRDEALCPYDIAENGALGDDDLFDIFSHRSRGVRLLFVSDSCHSGSVNRLGSFGEEDSPGKVRFLPPETYLSDDDFALARRMPNKKLRTLPLRSSALLLAGCQDYEFSYDARIDGRYNGAFTFVALKVLAELPKSATYRDWVREIRRYLPSQRYPQSPILAGTYSQRTWQVLS